MGKTWWKSRTIWAIVVGAVVQILVTVGVLAESSTTHVFEVVMLMLAAIFRWQAQGPLVSSGGQG